MTYKKENKLVIIENGQITSFSLDDKITWEVGRASPNNIPHIALKSKTVSRKHGKFQNMDGVWFYWDYNAKNGTIHNQKRIGVGIHGRVKPILLNDGDTFVFGGGGHEVINGKTIWALFITRDFGEKWSVIDTKGCTKLAFESDGNVTTLLNPSRGSVISKENGIAIYMGDLTYAIGDMQVNAS